ncbi:hypothetical protein SUSAZ_08855 [Sulfolobus acidocaldarius SUSAZ]|nr:hypothetical protein SUSAZ_08855 [Sulfolobus acidocaldarius SUSAZ]
MVMKGISYLLAFVILFGLLFYLVIYPYAVLFVKYLQSHKDFDQGAWATYHIFVEITIVDRLTNPTHIMDYAYEFKLNFSYFSNDVVNASITLMNQRVTDNYPNNYTTNPYSSWILVNKSNDLFEFFFPESNSLMIGRYYNLSICPNTGDTRFGPILGMPSNLGVPYRHYASNLIDHILISADISINCSIMKGEPTMLHFDNYGKLQKGYILLYYSQDFSPIGAGDAPGILRVETFVNYGSPLLSLITSNFNIPQLNMVLNEAKSIIQKHLMFNQSLIVDDIVTLYEGTNLDSTNILPVEQNFLGGVTAAYLSITPVSEILTLGVITTLFLFFR